MRGEERDKESCLNNKNLDLCNAKSNKWSDPTRRNKVIVEGQIRYEVKRYILDWHKFLFVYYIRFSYNIHIY